MSLQPGDEYRAVVNLDYTRSSRSPGYAQQLRAYQQLLKALEARGWSYVETSAMAYDGPLDDVLVALELLVRGIAAGGRLSALTVQVQRVGAARSAPGPETPQNSLTAVRGRPLPP